MVSIIVAVLAGFVSMAAETGVAYRCSSLRMTGSVLAVRNGDVTGDGLADVLVLLETTRDEERSKTVESDGEVVLTVESVTVRERAVHVYVQGAGGTFEARVVRLPVSAEAVAMDVADVDGDGRAEVLLLMPDGVDSISMAAPLPAPEQGAAALEPAPPDARRLVSCDSLFSAVTGFPDSLMLARDLDGDGTAELLVPTLAGLEVYWAGDDGYGAPAVVPLPSIGRTMAGGSLVYSQALPIVTDVDGDGLMDAVFLLESGELLAYPEKRRGVFVSRPITALFRTKGEGYTRRMVAAEDVTGDGRLDVVAVKLREGKQRGQEGAATLEVYAGDAELGVPALPSLSIDLGAPRKGESLAFCQVRDLDSDGRKELLPHFLRAGAMQMVKALVTKSATLSLRVPVVRIAASEKLVVAGEIEDEVEVNLKRLSLSYLMSLQADVDGDGVRDLIQPRGARELDVRRGRRDGTFEKGVIARIAIGDGEDLVGGLEVKDLDGDGRDDLIVTRESWNRDRLDLRVCVSAGGQP